MVALSLVPTFLSKLISFIVTQHDPEYRDSFYIVGLISTEIDNLGETIALVN